MSVFDQGEGGEEGQQRQCSVDEEITQEAGGKRRSVSACHAFMSLSLLSVVFYPSHVCEREIYGVRVTPCVRVWLIANVWARCLKESSASRRRRRRPHG